MLELSLCMAHRHLTLSVVLAVFNEEAHLGACLESVQGIADEIVIVDGGSTDKTVSIAKSFKARVIETDNPPIFHINKQKALDAARGEWVLLLDADERVPPELADEILMIVSSKDDDLENHYVDPKKYDLLMRHLALLAARDGAVGTAEGPIVAFYMPRRNYFLGKFLTYAGAYPDGTVRLVRKGKARFALRDVHDQMIIDGQVSVLSHDLIHLADPDFSRYLTRSNRYTSLQAQHWMDAYHKKPNIHEHRAPGIGFFSQLRWMVIAPLATFFLLFIRHKGFLDGFPGFVWSLYSALHVATSYVKYWEMRRQEQLKRR